MGRAGTIVTLGGGGFSTLGSGVSPIDNFLLALTGVPRPKVCFIGTASGDAQSYLTKFENAFASRAQITALTLFAREPYGYQDPSILLEQDLIYVGGGSTVNLLTLWRAHGLPDVLAQANSQGTVLAGISAGMNCWYEASDTDSWGALAPLNDGLGWLPGSACPHYFGEPGRAEHFQGCIARGELPSGHAVDDGVALVWNNGTFTEAISEKPGGEAFAISAPADEGEGCHVEPLTVRYLGIRGQTL